MSMHEAPADELRGDARPERERQRASTPAWASYLTVREVAALARCEHKAVRRAIANGELVAFQPAPKLLVREAECSLMD